MASLVDNALANCMLLLLATLLLLCDCNCWAAECPKPTPNWSSKNGGVKTRIRFINESPVDLVAYWVNYQGQDREEGPSYINAGDSIALNTSSGHRFRIYTIDHTDTQHKLLVKEYEVPRERGEKIIRLFGCNGIKAPPPVHDVHTTTHHEEMLTLVHDQQAPCLPHDDSTQWSCIRYISKEEYENRVKDGTVYGFNTTEEAQGRNIGDTIDTGYIRQIPNIPRVTNGKGYLKMSFTKTMQDILLPFYEQHKQGAPHDSVKDHGIIPGGYTNSHTVTMTKIELDDFPDVRDILSKELERILEWWTGQALIPTSTFGIRIYHHGSMLINHVDRADTHLASAVIQVAQTGIDQGWPLEIMHPDADSSVAEVYLQPGELVLYEGARFLHGRPMRFKGDSFANIFSHFRPVDWYGPGKSPKYDGLIDEQGYLPSSSERIIGGEERMTTTNLSDEL